MHFPLVSRAELDRTTEQLRASREDVAIWRSTAEKCSEAMRRWEEKYDALVRESLAMKREGFSQTPPTPAESPFYNLPAVVMSAIWDSTQGQPHDVRRVTTARAMALMREGLTPEKAAERIRQGERAD